MREYKGIVILTTNRTSSFDDSIVSGITLATVFNPLTAEARQRIGLQLLEAIKGDLYVSLDARKAWERWLRSSNWSGHDIKSSEHLNLFASGSDYSQISQVRLHKKLQTVATLILVLVPLSFYQYIILLLLLPPNHLR